MRKPNRERRKTFTLQQVRDIRDRLSSLVTEFDGFVQAAEKAGENTMFPIDGGESIYDAERDAIKWIYKCKAAFFVQAVPSADPPDIGEPEMANGARPRKRK